MFSILKRDDLSAYIECAYVINVVRELVFMYIGQSYILHVSLEVFSSCAWQASWKVRHIHNSIEHSRCLAFFQSQIVNIRNYVIYL